MPSKEVFYKCKCGRYFRDFEEAAACEDGHSRILKAQKAPTNSKLWVGKCKNICTGEYDTLFATEISDLLCVSRTIEKAKQTNDYTSLDGKIPPYKVEDIKLAVCDAVTYYSCFAEVEDNIVDELLSNCAQKGA